MSKSKFDSISTVLAASRAIELAEMASKVNAETVSKFRQKESKSKVHLTNRLFPYYGDLTETDISGYTLKSMRNSNSVLAKPINRVQKVSIGKMVKQTRIWMPSITNPISLSSGRLPSIEPDNKIN